MRATFLTGGPRNGILLSKGLQEPWTAAAPLPASNNEVFKLYPNPVRQELTLQCSETWIGRNIRIYNSTGALVLQHTVKASTSTIPTTYLKPGMYFLEGDNGGKIRSRFVKL